MGDTTALVAAIQQLSTDVQALIASQSGSDQSAIDAATAQVQGLSASVVAATPVADATATVTTEGATS
jgi:hypothetical protein